MRDELRSRVPASYSGRAHAFFTFAASIGTTVLLVSQLRAVKPLELTAVPAFFVFCCLLEYVEHRYLLHKSSRIGAEAFRIHTLEHHRFFTDDEFRPDTRSDYAYLLFPRALVTIYMLVLVPAFTAAFYFGVSPNVGWLVGATAAAFFLLYELIHFASHAGEGWWARIPGVRRLSEHHRLHHRLDRMTSQNFNVVCPIIDWLFGTLATR